MTRKRDRWSAWTLPLGLALIALSEAMLFIDVQHRGGLIVSEHLSAGDLPGPGSTLQAIARWFAVNMTPLCWVGYLLALDGTLVLLGRRRGQRDIVSLRQRPNRFIVAWLTSVPVWCVFDWFNFYYMDAWRYHGLPPSLLHRMVGYFIAFAAISPGMFLTAQVYQYLLPPRPGIDTAQPAHAAASWLPILLPWGLISLTVLAFLPFQPEPLSEPIGIAGSALLLLGPPAAALLRRRSQWTVALAVGVAFTTWTVLARDPLSNFTLWVGLIFLLDPLNARLGPPGTPSLIRDWQTGRFGRTFALGAAGLTCGFLWEFWNYWAIAKWSYHLPFLGPLETVRYFEMPLPGLLGFIPFACECWVMLNTIIALLHRLSGGRLRLAEPLPDPRAIL